MSLIEQIRRSDGKTELFVVPPSQTLDLRVFAGDKVTFSNPEGRQVGLLSAPKADALPPLGVQGIDPSRGSAAAILFDERTEAGARETFVAQSEMELSLHVPGKAMEPDEQDTATALFVEVVRADTIFGQLPPPLAAPKLDVRIDAATAAAYEVKKGDYIQIIDVDGKQCSDFLAFDADALERGEEHGLDATTTRTLMGSSFSLPGLHAKYFDDRMVPLVEVIRDTVGRHDTFLLACAAKYYEDMGYPGHPNCTENFNRALEPHRVAPRAGWPAINFFYNTGVDEHDRIGMDEPWSRPGDYVLLRALTDLVCASSSCADDVDAANGWNPTDIHVRVYDGAENFTKGVAHRMTSDAAPRLSKETAFHPRTAPLCRKFEEYRGYWLPTEFTDTGAIAEYWACRERAAIMDLSALRKFEVTGPDAEALLDLAVPRNIRKLSVGQVVYTPICYEHGGMIDDGTIFRLDDHNFRFVCGDDYTGVWLRELAAERGLKVWVRSSTEQLHNVAVQGPKSREILSQIMVTPPHLAPVSELRWFRFTTGKIAGHAVVISRTGYTGELGFEVWCHPNVAPEVWDAIMEAGEAYGIAPLGLAALDMLRIEAGLVFAGYDFGDDTDPFEAGIGFTVPKEKPAAYIGDEVLAERRVHPRHKLVGLDVEGREDIAHGDCVQSGRAQVGVVTSAMRSPILGKTIALARVEPADAEIGTKLEIGKLDGQQKRIAATVVRFPHYDRDKTRVRS